MGTLNNIQQENQTLLKFSFHLSYFLLHDLTY